MRPGSVRATLVPALALFLATACSEGPATRLEDYLARVARPLGEEPPALAATVVPRVPRAEAMQITIEADGIDGLDFLKLRGCAVQTTIARRNSSLGRMAPPSQRLLLELAYLRDAPPCVRKLREESNEELADLLENSYASKKEQLPALIFNATLGSREFRDFWRSPGTLGNYPAETSSAPITALERINALVGQWLSGDYTADESVFELTLSEVANGDGGELLEALTLQREALDQASSMALKETMEGPLCDEGLIPASAPILRTVATTYFIGRIQPWSAQLSQRYHTLLAPIEALERRVQPALPPAYERWRLQRDASLAQGLAAPREHVRSLQTLLGSCYAEFAPAKDDS
ncbi:MAG: DUF3080 family protein [Pseudomonadota bacterium]